MGSSSAFTWPPRFPPITDVVSEGTCDIVIIGAGIAGCTAAEAASREGASVICCEKSSGYTAHSVDIGAIGTVVQVGTRIVFGETEESSEQIENPSPAGADF